MAVAAGGRGLRRYSRQSSSTYGGVAEHDLRSSWPLLQIRRPCLGAFPVGRLVSIVRLAGKALSRLLTRESKRGVDPPQIPRERLGRKPLAVLLVSFSSYSLAQSGIREKPAQCRRQGCNIVRFHQQRALLINDVFRKTINLSDDRSYAGLHGFQQRNRAAALLQRRQNKYIRLFKIRVDIGHSSRHRHTMRKTKPLHQRTMPFEKYATANQAGAKF